MSSSILLATGSYDRTVKLWKVGNAEHSRTIGFQDSQINALAVSRDGCLLAVAGFATIKIFDVSSTPASSGQPQGQDPIATAPLAQIQSSQDHSHSGNVMSIGFLRMTSQTQSTPSHVLYSIGEDGKLKLWEIKPPTMKFRKEIDSRVSLNAAFLHPNNQLLVTGSQNATIALWSLTSGDVASGTQLGLSNVEKINLIRDESAIRTLAISPNGKILVVGNNRGRVFCFALRTPAEAAVAQQQQPAQERGTPPTLVGVPEGSFNLPNSSIVESTSTAPGGRTHLNVAGGGAGAVDTQSSAADELTHRHQDVPVPSDGSPTGIAAHGPGSATSAPPVSSPTQSTPVIPWASQGNCLALVWTFEAHNKYLLKLALSPNGQTLATASADCSVILWKIPQTIGTEPFASAIAAAVTNAGGSSGQDSLNSGVQTVPWTVMTRLTGHQRWVWDVTFSRDSAYVVTSASDHTGRLWAAQHGRLLTTYSGHQKPVTCILLDERSNPQQEKT